MRIDAQTAGAFMSNCYLVAADGSSAAVAIDAGDDAAEVLEARLTALGLRLEAVLLTHGHYDHVASAADLADAAGVPTFLHPADRYLLEDPGAGVGARVPWQVRFPPDLRDLCDGDRLRFGGLDLSVAHTPGHTPGHCTFLIGDALFSGDLIFAGSVGRTDFPRGSTQDLIASIQRTVLPLPDGTRILSGHGPETAVGVERRTNPYLYVEAIPRARGL